jgi:deazaflavin-dependent oxidoreductase (nitroreductase family)
MITELAKHTLNPLIKWMADIGFLPPMIAIIETVGRKSGELRQAPVGNGLEGNTFWVVAEHGHHAAYVKNIVANPSVRVKVGRRWLKGTAHLMPEDDPIERIRKIGLKVNGAVVLALGKSPLTVRIDLDADQ